MKSINDRLEEGIGKDELLEAVNLIPNNARIKIRGNTLLVTFGDEMRTIGRVIEDAKEKEFEIWMEGFAITGNNAKAVRIATNIKGRTFTGAVKAYYKSHPDTNFNPDTLSVWGCKLYPTEGEARRSFG